MVILIQSPRESRDELEVEQELQRAFEILHSAQIRALGGGRFQDGSGYIVLAREADGRAALSALDNARIGASELKPRIDPEKSKFSGFCSAAKPRQEDEGALRSASKRLC